MWPLIFDVVRDVRGCWRICCKRTMVEYMETLVVVEVETLYQQEAPLEEPKMSAFEVELGPRAQKKKNQEVESAEREDPA